MTSITEGGTKRSWRVPVIPVAILTGCLVTFPAANVLAALVARIPVPTNAAIGALAAAEAAFLAAFLWWMAGGGPPRMLKPWRAAAARNFSLSRTQWMWAGIAALAFAVTIHAAIVILFRLVPYPVEAFRAGYAVITRLPTQGMKWTLVVLAAASAAITEETGFRGYMQQPIEARHGVFIAVLVSATLFTVGHLNQAWAVPGMLLVAAFAGALLGCLAWASGSLIPGILGHFIMDVGLFAYWWTDTAGTFTAKTIAVTGIDAPFLIACATCGLALVVVLVSIGRLWSLRTVRVASR